MNDQIELPFEEGSEEQMRMKGATQELHQPRHVPPARLSKDDFDIDPNHMEGDVVS